MGRFTPGIGMTLEMPTRAEDISKRLHNQYTKTALRETLQAHHKRTIRGRFEPSARTKYDHAPRSAKYVARKKRKFGHTIDLVYTGATRRDFTRPGKPVQIGGTGSAGTLVGKLLMRFPFAEAARAENQRTGKVRKHARTAQLAKELSAWTDEEARWAAEEFLRRYMLLVEAYRGQRKRKRLPKS